MERENEQNSEKMSRWRCEKGENDGEGEKGRKGKGEKGEKVKVKMEMTEVTDTFGMTKHNPT